jgi:hypothetical protein
MEKTQVMVYFSMFADEFPLDVVTKQLDIEPTESYKKGDIIKKISPIKNHVRAYTCWKLSTGYQESLVGEQMDMIIDQIGDKSAIINELKRQFGLECRFTIVIIMNNGYSPGLYLDKSIIAFANSINADFDFDLYANPYDEIAE